MEIVAAIVTIIVGFLGTGFIGASMNWPDAGAIFAIATMGASILRAIRHPKDKQNQVIIQIAKPEFVEGIYGEIFGIVSGSAFGITHDPCHCLYLVFR